MNLFVETLVSYLKDQCERVRDLPPEAREVRLFVQSLPPDPTYHVLEAMEAYMLESTFSLERHLKIAKGLWAHWGEQSEKPSELLHRIQERGWVDLEDQLTYYRNCLCPPHKDGLIVIIIGLDHASDQGGLADFHVVREKTLWEKQLGNSYEGWIQRLFSACGVVDVDNKGKPFFHDYFDTLFQLRHRSLLKLAGFIEDELVSKGAGCDTPRELIELAFERLPVWEIPPLLHIPSSSKQAMDVLKQADRFISHRAFQNLVDRRTALEKIHKAREENSLDIPETLGYANLYPNREEYLQTIESFIVNGDLSSRERLLKTDLSPLLKVLKQKRQRKPPPTPTIRLQGPSLTVFLQAVWNCLIDFKKACAGEAAQSLLDEILITVQCFRHDINIAEDDDSIDRDDLAEQIMLACLGGLDTFLKDMCLSLHSERDATALDKEIPIRLRFGSEEKPVEFFGTRTRPSIEFNVQIRAAFENVEIAKEFAWILDAIQEERVRDRCARKVLDKLRESNHPILPAFHLTRVLTELFFAADAEEANRLVNEGLTDLQVINVFDGMHTDNIDSRLLEAASKLSEAYRTFLESLVNKGYYATLRQPLLRLTDCYEDLVKLILAPDTKGRNEILNRFYKAFLVIPEKVAYNESYLPSAVALGITPAVAELTQAREIYLRDNFLEVVALLLEKGIPSGEAAWERLLSLVAIHRPLIGIIKDIDHRLSTHNLSFGLIHCLGEAPSSELSLASQSIMREDDIEDDLYIRDLVRPNAESRILQRVLEDYRRLHPYANDQLRIFIANVNDLNTALAGVHHYLDGYLKEMGPEVTPYQVYVKILTTSISPIATANQLDAWRNYWAEQAVVGQRQCQLQVGYRYAPTIQALEDYLKQEPYPYDIVFLMRFMDNQQGGDEIEPSRPFAFDYSTANIGKFPISEYPRPIRVSDLFRRQTLLSNRRFQLPTLHTALSAHLKHPHQTHPHHVVFGQVDFSPWNRVVEEMHHKGEWVACIDPYIDKRLLEEPESSEGTSRKIIGFSCGHGRYGELNLTVSTEADTLARLTELICRQLRRLFPAWSAETCEQAAKTVVAEAQELPGLSLIRAIGSSEYIRDVVAYALVRRLLTDRNATITALVPIDSFRHWFEGAEVDHIPDLLHLDAVVEGHMLKVYATVLECKLARRSEQHVEKALAQAAAGLRHFTRIFLPNRDVPSVLRFDQRYWWAQLQRALATRALVNITDEEYQRLGTALERLTEGYYAIEWQAAVVTLWSDQEQAHSEPQRVGKPSLLDVPLEGIPPDFGIYHVVYGSGDVARIFTREKTVSLTIPGGGLCWLPEERPTSLPRSLDGNTDQASFPLESKPHVPEGLSAGDQGDKGHGEITVISSDINNPSMMQEVQSVSISVPVPSRLLLGTDRNNEPIYWEFGHLKLQNRHMLIFGASGSGKTYAIQCILAELALQRQNSVIVDYTDGFLPNHMEPLLREQASPLQHLVRQDPLPINPFRCQIQEIEGFEPLRETSFQVATRVASVFTSVYSTIGEQQVAALVRAIDEGMQGNPTFSLKDLLECLEHEGDVGMTLANKLAPFIRTGPFQGDVQDSWRQMLENQDRHIHILQLVGVSRDIQRLITEFVLWDFYDYATTHGNKDRPIPIVLDEIQNLDHRSESPLEKLLREGRKFGISLILATQTLSGFASEARDRLFQAAHKLFFAPASTEVRRFADILKDSMPGSDRENWIERLSNLQKGECLSLGSITNGDGSLRNRVVQIKITPLEKRFEMH